MKQYIRKADIILFIVLVALGLAASAALSLSQAAAGTGSKVVIESGGRLYATYSLLEDRTVTVPAYGQSGNDQADPDQDGSSQGDSDQDNSGQDSSGRDSSDRGGNVVEIRDGTVSVTSASCKNQVCVKHSPISKSGESIVCLPNRLVVRIEGGSGNDEEGEGYDSITS